MPSHTDDDLSAKRVGTTLRDKWVLEELLGVGGMASVYAARHKIGRRDAIKILHAKVAASDQLRARFEQEAHAVNAFRHPGVVEIRDVDTTEDGAPFLVMELLEGEPLASRLGRPPPMDAREVFDMGAQVLDVLAAAHGRGIIHRDIKPDNVFLARDVSGRTRVKVLDFGIARVRSADRKALTTKAGVTLGTMQYMAPEQARGEPIDARADVYAIGATMFRALAGRVVHEVDSEAALVMRVIAFGAPRFATVMPNVAPGVAAVIDRSLAFDASDRYPDAATMLADVRAVLEGNAPPYATGAPPLLERAPGSALFAASSADPKGKPTVVARARSNEVAPVTRPAPGTLPADALPSRAEPVTEPAPGTLPLEALPSQAQPVTVIGMAALGPEALPPRVQSSSAPTRLSPVGLPLPSSGVPSTSPSERVVVVPPQGRGVAASVQAGASEVATVYGMPPPPGLAQQGPASASAPVLTPFGELSAFVRSGPSVLLLAIGGGVALLALVLMVVAIVWFAHGPSTNAADGPANAEEREAPETAGRPPPAAPTTTTTTTTTGPSRRPKR